MTSYGYIEVCPTCGVLVREQTFIAPGMRQYLRRLTVVAVPCRQYPTCVRTRDEDMRSERS